MDVLLTLLGVTVGIVAVLALVTLVAVLLGLRTLKRRNRVSPVQPTEAPVTWLASPAVAARLHRRLRSAVSVSRMIAARHAGDRSPSSAAEMAADVERQALALDGQLTAVAGLAARDRRRLLAQLAAEVRQVEVVVSRLSVLDAQAVAPAQLAQQRSAMDDLSDKLDHLEAARHELAGVDADAGLTRPSPFTAGAPEPEPRRLRRGHG